MARSVVFKRIYVTSSSIGGTIFPRSVRNKDDKTCRWLACGGSWSFGRSETGVLLACTRKQTNMAMLRTQLSLLSQLTIKNYSVARPRKHLRDPRCPTYTPANVNTEITRSFENTGIF